MRGVGAGGTKVEDRLSHLSPFTFTWDQGVRRPQVVVPEPRPLGPQVERVRIGPPSGGRGQLPMPPAVTVIKVKVKTLPLAVIPGCCTCPLPLGWGLHSRARGLTLGSQLRGLRVAGRTPGALTNSMTAGLDLSTQQNRARVG